MRSKSNACKAIETFLFNLISGGNEGDTFAVN